MTATFDLDACRNQRAGWVPRRCWTWPDGCQVVCLLRAVVCQARLRAVQQTSICRSRCCACCAGGACSATGARSCMGPSQRWMAAATGALESLLVECLCLAEACGIRTLDGSRNRRAEALLGTPTSNASLCAKSMFHATPWT